ncbi:MAG: DUF4124 domain-containing protein [Candidatus Thiodiazotropha sp.]
MPYRFLTALCLTLLFSSPLQAEVYRWTDEKGRVHFSDRPTSESAKEIDLREASPPNGPSHQAMPEDRKEMRKRMLEVFEQERAEKREAAVKKKEERKERKRKCLDARARYENYNTAGSIYDYTESGERKYLDKQQRREYLAKLKADVERYCD